MPGQPLPTTLITTPFAAEATNINVIPITPGAPGFACFQLGWQVINETPIASGGIAPKCEDMNGIFNAITQYSAYFAAGQIPPYNATLATALSGYALNAIVARSDNTGFWLNQLGGNATNPDSGGTNWVPFGNSATTPLFIALTNANVNLTNAQAARSIIILQGAITGNILLTFPTWPNAQWLVINATTGNFVVTVTTSGGTPITLQQGGGNSYSVGVWCDGTNLYLSNIGPQTGDFTATPQGGTYGSGDQVVFWTRAGNQVTMYLPAMVVASSGTSFYYTGIPAAMIPPSHATLRQEFSLANCQSNSAYAAGGSVYLDIVSGTPEIIFLLASSATGWSASGNKYALGSFTYNIGL